MMSGVTDTTDVDGGFIAPHNPVIPKETQRELNGQASDKARAAPCSGNQEGQRSRRETASFLAALPRRGGLTFCCSRPSTPTRGRKCVHAAAPGMGSCHRCREALRQCPACSLANNGSGLFRGRIMIHALSASPGSCVRGGDRQGPLPVPACRRIDVTVTPKTSGVRPDIQVQGAVTVPTFDTPMQAPTAVLVLRCPG